MKKLLHNIGWDLRIQLRSNIVTIAAVVTLLYIGIFYFIPLQGRAKDIMAISLIFSDPCFLGFMFIGALVLFERSAHTLQALVVTPMPRWQYLWSKALSLTLIALPCSLAMALVAHGPGLQYGWLLLAVALSSVLFVFIGFAGVARCRTFNQFILVLPTLIIPAFIPILPLLGLPLQWWYYLLPTQASIVLFRAAFGAVPVWELLYALAYLALSIALAYRFAAYSFSKYITRSEDQ